MTEHRSLIETLINGQRKCHWILWQSVINFKTSLNMNKLHVKRAEAVTFHHVLAILDITKKKKK